MGGEVQRLTWRRVPQSQRGPGAQWPEALASGHPTIDELARDTHNENPSARPILLPYRSRGSFFEVKGGGARIGTVISHPAPCFTTTGCFVESHVRPCAGGSSPETRPT